MGRPAQDERRLPLYRTDQVDKAPETWQEVYDIAAKNDGIAYQGASNEGLTVNFLELAFAAGGKILSDDGKKPEIDSAENVKALKFMVDGIKSGAAPKAVDDLHGGAGAAHDRVRQGDLHAQLALLLRARPGGPEDQGQVRGRPVPRVRGRRQGRHPRRRQLVISTYSKNPGGALKFIDYMTHEERQSEDVVKFSDASPLKAVYDDPAVQKAQPFSDELKTAIEQAKTRPVSPVYSQVSAAIYKNVNKALSGNVSPEDALKKAQSDMQKALETF